MRLKRLVLILVVLLGIGWLAIQPSVTRREPPSYARIQAAKTQISSFKSALEMFQVDNGFYPTTDQGLEALVEKPDNATNWIGPYQDMIPLDPWGNAYHYRHPGIHNGYGFDIFSYGPDGASETGGNDNDDIRNWSKPVAFGDRILAEITKVLPLLILGLVILASLILRKRSSVQML